MDALSAEEKRKEKEIRSRKRFGLIFRLVSCIRRGRDPKEGRGNAWSPLYLTLSFPLERLEMYDNPDNDIPAVMVL